MIKDDRRESEIQSSIVKLLRGFGFTVLVTSRNLQRGGSAIQKGIPDLLVSIPGVPYAWVGLEVKTAKGRVRPEQQELHDSLKVAIVRNERQAIVAVAGALALVLALALVFSLDEAEDETVRSLSQTCLDWLRQDKSVIDDVEADAVKFGGMNA